MKTDALQLQSDKLVLRPVTIDDFGFLARLWADPAVVRYITGEPLGEEDVWRRLLAKIGHWQSFGYGYWIVREKDSGALVGETGIALARRGMTQDDAEIPDAGWVFAPEFHGKGYAGEAMRSLFGWFDRTVGSDHVRCIIDPENTASRRVAEKCGFEPLAQMTYHGDTVLLMQRARGAKPSPVAASD